MAGRWIALAMAAALTVGCGSKDDEPPPAPKPKAETPVHCFFKDDETSSWKLKTTGPDKAEVSGRAYRSDGRYKAVLLDPRTEGRVLVVLPSIALNDTGFSTEDNWWDVKQSIPTADIDTVEVRCGKKVLASLPVDHPAG